MSKKRNQPNNPKFKVCPRCGGGIDYFNSCCQCGRSWTPELSPTEKLEKEEGIEDEDEPAPPAAEEEPAGDSHLAQPLWQIAPDDGETEIARKRSLMRLDTQRTYSAMGLAVRVHEHQRSVLQYLTRLWGVLDEGEREAFAPVAELLKKVMAEVTQLRQKKVEAAVAMEKLVSQQYEAARRVRFKLPAKKKSTAAKAASETPEDLPPLDPQELIAELEANLKLRSLRPQDGDEEEDD